ncbi:3709_t:CDS:2 [Entrophospora sp. SA101]|nr:3709_t:CDS:2 [Entrophospora sp. SA101]
MSHLDLALLSYSFECPTQFCKKNCGGTTNESTTIATFVLHPNVIQAIKDKSPDDEHFDNVRHFYFGENQFGCVNQYANGF